MLATIHGSVQNLCDYLYPPFPHTVYTEVPFMLVTLATSLEVLLDAAPCYIALRAVC